MTLVKECGVDFIQGDCHGKSGDLCPRSKVGHTLRGGGGDTGTVPGKAPRLAGSPAVWAGSKRLSMWPEAGVAERGRDSDVPS